MSYLILGGHGQQGQQIARFLHTYSDEKVRIVDTAFPYMSRPGNEEYICGDAFEYMRALGKGLQRHVVIDCLRPELAIEIVKLCNHYNAKGYLNLGGNDTVTDQLLPIAMIPAMLDVGIAPGLPATMLGHAVRNKYNAVSIMCGGVKLHPKSWDTGYFRSFSTEGLYGELTGLAEIIYNDQIQRWPTLCFAFNDQLHINECAYEGKLTSGAFSFACAALRKQLQRALYFTLRTPEHWKLLKEDILWRSKKEAIEIMNDLFPPVDMNHPDQVIFHYCLQDGEGREEKKTWQWKYDFGSQTSAMAQATGNIAGAVATLLHDEMFTEGAHGMHEVDLHELIRRTCLVPNQFQEIPIAKQAPVV